MATSDRGTTPAATATNAPTGGSATWWAAHDTPLGRLTLAAGPGGLTRLHFGGRAPAGSRPADRGAIRDHIAQLDGYFAGRRRSFELALDLRGSAFQVAVWEQLLLIPYGSTTSYGEVARAIDLALYGPGVEEHMRPRAVGAAVGANPIAIVVPCHRVVGADGSLTGYRGGLERKRALLELEGADVVAARGRRDAQLVLLSDAAARGNS
jgi:methylated-DNA-[protein]-cysteine S-methyltransferase